MGHGDISGKGRTVSGRGCGSIREGVWQCEREGHGDIAGKGRGSKRVGMGTLAGMGSMGVVTGRGRGSKREGGGVAVRESERGRE